MATRPRRSPESLAERPSAEGLRVALFSGNYNYIKEGANQALNKLVAHLLERGAAVRVYSPTTSTPAFEPAGELVSVPSVTIPGRGEFRLAIGLPKSIERDVRSFAPNLVHVSTPDWLGFAAQRLARRLDVPVIASMHTRFEIYFGYYGLGLLKSWAVNRQKAFYRRSDRVLVPNKDCRTHLKEMGVEPGRLSIWSRGVDHEIFAPARRDLQWRRKLRYADDELVLLFFGRLVREKGPAQFIETVAELRRRGLRLKPLIVGDGPARIDMARVGESVFTGELQGEALGRAIASADVLLNPSTTEAFGNVVLEAMAAGLGVVSADVGSARALITHGLDGFLCQPDPRAFADAIETLTPALGDAVGAQARRTALRYEWNSVLDEVVRTYRELRP